MAKRIKLKAHVKSHCDHSHYLELCQSFDDKNVIYRRYCTKCGKWWTYSEHFEKEQDEVEIICHSLSGKRICTLSSLPRITRVNQTMIFDDGHGCRDTYELKVDGTLGKLIRKEYFHGNN